MVPPGCSYGFIVGGWHVAPSMLRLALRGAGTPMLVTDAMPNVGGVKKTFALYGGEIIVDGDRCTTKNGRLAGSGIAMGTPLRHCVKSLAVPPAGAFRFPLRQPAE